MSNKILKPIDEADLGTLLVRRQSSMPQRVQFWINGKKRKAPINSLVMRLVVPGRADIQIVYGANMTIGANGADDITRRELGGVISAYFTIVDGQLMIGVLRQRRPCQDLNATILNVVRAYLDPSKTRLATVEARAEERAGVPTTLLAIELPCDQGNANNANVETYGGHGNTQFAFFVPANMLVRNGEFYTFDQTIVKPFDPDAGKILGLEFHPWKVAARVGDDFTRAIVSPLLAWLDDMDQISIVVDREFNPSVMSK